MTSQSRPKAFLKPTSGYAAKSSTIRLTHPDTSVNYLHTKQSCA